MTDLVLPPLAERRYAKYPRLVASHSVSSEGIIAFLSGDDASKARCDVVKERLSIEPWFGRHYRYHTDKPDRAVSHEIVVTSDRKIAALSVLFVLTGNILFPEIHWIRSFEDGEGQYFAFLRPTYDERPPLESAQAREVLAVFSNTDAVEKLWTNAQMDFEASASVVQQIRYLSEIRRNINDFKASSGLMNSYKFDWDDMRVVQDGPVETCRLVPDAVDFGISAAQIDSLVSLIPKAGEPVNAALFRELVH